MHSSVYSPPGLPNNIDRALRNSSQENTRKEREPVMPRTGHYPGSDRAILSRSTSKESCTDSALGDDDYLSEDDMDDTKPLHLDPPDEEGYEWDWENGPDGEQDDTPNPSPLVPGQRLTRDQVEYLNYCMGVNWRNYRGPMKPGHAKRVMNPAYDIGITQPSGSNDWIKDRASQYAENPLAIMKAATSMVLYGVMGAVLATSVLGAFMTLGISSATIATVAVPTLVVASIWGASLGLYNDFVLDKPLLSNDFHWLDGLTKTAYLRRFEFPTG